ncbi:hypothetical protein CJA_2507 [Cellvibrio japonicus Ueda107]|uniref:Uncharacterized protein n=1 Tax=Cellvibrio japonicus (strain Ueda107) TaxID=498211 RepID=B3PKZ4_CELJU|nr:hypothetical protein CJA_2507 [Cellvibrio japonicus Ueda107]
MQKGCPAFLWVFTRNGLHVYYSIPGNTETRDNKVENDIEILSLLEPGETGKSIGEEAEGITPSVKTLGGIRLRYRYNPPALQGIEVTKVTWKINKKGAYCLDYGIGSDHCPSQNEREPDIEFEQKSPQVDWSVYWEPRNEDGKPDWSNWADDDGVMAYVKAEYTLPVIEAGSQQEKRVTKTYEQDFYIKTRELKPLAAPSEPMKGSDVQILEAMLWGFGVSPQRGSGNQTKSNAGSEGNRIHSSRGAAGMTENCDGSDAKVRNIYSGGWVGCANGKVALEAMVRRFQGRNTATCDKNEESCTDNYAGRTSSTNGVVDQATLVMLEKIWKEFYSAYVSHKSKPVIAAPELAWSNEAVSIWDGVTDAGIVSTYTDTKHNAMLAAVNNNATGTRGDLLDAWIRQESANKFWGQGFPATHYRVFEGGGDEFASLGYNQIKYAYRYGVQAFQNLCPQLKSYNMYKPDDNIKGMVAFTTAIGCGSGGGFRRAFATGGSWTTIKSNNVDLKGYKLAGENTFYAMDKDRVDDAYELLAKAIGSYNGGTGMGSTWANMLKATNPGLDNGKPRMGRAHSNRTYAIQVLRRFGAPARTYIWKGGVEPDQIPVIGADGSPETNEDGSTKMQANPKAGQDWCFAYGEQEWMSGKDWSKVKAAAASVTLDGKPQVPSGNIACQ